MSLHYSTSVQNVWLNTVCSPRVWRGLWNKSKENKNVKPGPFPFMYLNELNRRHFRKKKKKENKAWWSNKDVNYILTLGQVVVTNSYLF